MFLKRERCSFLFSFSKSLRNKISLSAALSFDNGTQFSEISCTSNAFDNLVFRSQAFESSVFISIVPRPSVELLLLLPLVVVPVSSLSI